MIEKKKLLLKRAHELLDRAEELLKEAYVKHLRKLREIEAYEENKKWIKRRKARDLRIQKQGGVKV